MSEPDKKRNMVDVASEIVSGWLPSKRAAFEQRTGLILNPPDQFDEMAERLLQCPGCRASGVDIHPFHECPIVYRLGVAAALREQAAKAEAELKDLINTDNESMQNLFMQIAASKQRIERLEKALNYIVAGPRFLTSEDMAERARAALEAK